MSEQTPEMRQRQLKYAFGHIVDGFGTDAHAGDSAELGDEVLTDMGFTTAEKAIVHTLAEHVAGNYQYTGEATDLLRQIERGEA